VDQIETAGRHDHANSNERVARTFGTVTWKANAQSHTNGRSSFADASAEWPRRGANGSTDFGALQGGSCFYGLARTISSLSLNASQSKTYPRLRRNLLQKESCGMKPWEIFLEKYRAFGEKPSRESHARLFAPDATILHPGMSHPMPAAQYVDFIVEGLKRLPEFHLIPIHWAVSGHTIFVEARNTAVVKGQPIQWPAIYVVTLRDEMVIRGRPYYDRAEALAPFEPSLAGNVPNSHTTILEGVEPSGSSSSDTEAYATQVYDKIVAPYATNGKDPDPVAFQQFYRQGARMINPGFERPLRREELPNYYKSLKSQIRNLQLHLLRWAVSPELLFIEWTITGQVFGKNLVLPNCDRFTLFDMLATEGVAYFDNLALRALFEPNLSRFTNASFANLATGNAEMAR
jgi:hypothetical protein